MEHIRREYTVRQRVVQDIVYIVEGDTKKDVIRKVENGEVMDVGEHYLVKRHKPIVEDTHYYYDCPNNGEGWSDISLNRLKEMEIGEFKWHYNGKCKGEARDRGLCDKCKYSMKNGYRLLTNEEKIYLNNKYNLEFNVE